jgi:hypothetical protein
LVLAAYVVTSAVATGADPQRKKLLAAIHGGVAPLSATGRVEQIDNFEPDDVQRLLAVPQQQPLVDVDASHVDDEGMRPAVRNLHVRQISNSLKHVLALRKAGALDAAGGGFALVLEDDAAFGDTAHEAIARAVRDAPPDADLIFLGLPSARTPGAGMASPALFDNPLDVFRNHVFPCCESYLVKPAAAARIAAAYMPIRFPTACQLTYLARRRVFQPYAVVPNAFVDASKLGLTPSSLDANNQLLWNQAYCRCDVLVRQPGYDPLAYEELWQQQPFKDHPDVLALHAQHLEATGKLDDAQAACARALELYERHGCLLVGSEFLKRYMALFGRKQA